MKGRILNVTVMFALIAVASSVLAYWSAAGRVSVTIDRSLSFERLDSQIWELKAAVDEGESIEAIENLIRTNSKLVFATIGGQQPIHWAAAAARPDVVELLLRQGADVNAMVVGDWAGRGNTPLMYAVVSADLPTVRLLLDYGANPLEL